MFEYNKIKTRITFTRLALVFLIISLPLLYGCKEKLVRFDESGETFYVQIDDVIKLQLPGDPSTGNAWRKIFYDDSVVIRVGKKNYKIGDQLTGDGGFYYYRFRAIAPGTSIIKMEYGNRFESDKKAIKHFEITVIVDDLKKKSKKKEMDLDQPYE